MRWSSADFNGYLDWRVNHIKRLVSSCTPHLCFLNFDLMGDCSPEIHPHPFGACLIHTLPILLILYSSEQYRLLQEILLALGLQILPSVHVVLSSITLNRHGGYERRLGEHILYTDTCHQARWAYFVQQSCILSLSVLACKVIFLMASTTQPTQL